VKSSPKKVAANLFILQGGAEPLSSAPVWAEPSQLLIGMWLLGARKDYRNRVPSEFQGRAGSPPASSNRFRSRYPIYQTQKDSPYFRQLADSNQPNGFDEFCRFDTQSLGKLQDI
jgi:hypothetical protein